MQWTNYCLEQGKIFEKVHFSPFAGGHVSTHRFIQFGCVEQTCHTPTPVQSCCHQSCFSSCPCLFSWTVTSSHCAFSSITRPYCPGHLKAFPHSISLLHLCPSRCFLVIFCVVCFGCSSVSHHSHLMTGCFLSCQCCFSWSHSLSPRHTILLPSIYILEQEEEPVDR